MNKVKNIGVKEMRNIAFSPPDMTEEEVAEVKEAILSGWITTGPKTKEFERQVAEYCNVNRAVCLTLQEQAEVIAELFAQSPEKKSKIIYKPETQNNTPSYLFSMEKVKRDFDFEPAFGDFTVKMSDYKKDLDAHKFQDLFKY